MSLQTQTIATILAQLSKATASLQSAIARGDFDNIGIELSEEYMAATKARETATRILIAIEQEKTA